MKKLNGCCRIAILLAGLLLTPQLDTFADIPAVKEQKSSNIVSQANESTPVPKIGEKADTILRQMSDFIESQENFSFSAETERDFLTTSGVYLIVSHKGNIIANRPNQFWANATGDLVQREFIYLK